MSLKNIISTVVLNYLNEAYVDQDNSLQDMEQGDINEILKGYISAALWTEEERLHDEKIMVIGKKIPFASFKYNDVDTDSVIDAYNDIKTFIKNAGDDAVQEAIDENGLFRLGVDIWLTRNGHGSGFFDHNYENEDILMNAAKKLNSKDIYLGDDGELHFM